MPRSRTTSPIPIDISNSFVPGLTLTLHSPKQNSNDDNNPNNNSCSSSSSPAKKKHKYIKPRIGSYFQATVGEFDEELAKTTVQKRTLEKKNGLCGYYSYNSAASNGNVIGGEYGDNGGLFAATGASNASNNTYSGNNGVGRRKKAGRPPKSTKGNSKGKLLQVVERLQDGPFSLSSSVLESTGSST